MVKYTSKPFDLPDSLLCWRWQIVTDDYGVYHSFVMAEYDGDKTAIPAYLENTEGHNNDVTHVQPYQVRTSQDCGPFPAGVVHVNSGSLTFWYSIDPGGEHPYSDCYRIRCDQSAMVEEHITVQAHYNASSVLLPVNIQYSKTTARKIELHDDIMSYHLEYASNERQIFVLREPRWVPPSKEGIWRYAGGSVPWYKDDTWAWTTPVTLVYDPITYTSAKSVQVFKEQSWIFGLAQRPWRVNQFMASAFYNMYQQFPKFNDNNIANLIEMSELVIDVAKSGGVEPLLEAAASFVDFLKGGNRPREIFHDLGDMWLKYRYCYSTTKSDVQQALENKARKQITYLRKQHFNGVYRTEYSIPDGGKTTVTARVSCDVVQQTADMVKAIKHGLYMNGLEMSAYTMWDLVPFSFIADWFCDIGGKLQEKQDKQHYSDYVFTDVVWSLAYDRSYHNVDNHCYSRWYDNHIPDEAIAQAETSSSAKTWFKRTGDVVSLVL